MVLEDLAAKDSGLRAFRLSPAAGYRDRSYAAIQLFMLQLYSGRIRTFRAAAAQALEELGLRVQEGERPEGLNQAIVVWRAGLARMKTRMKHMIDVSDKYAVIDIFDTISIFDKLSLAMDPAGGPPPREEQPRRVSDSSAEERPPGTGKTLRSLSDHVCLLGRAYCSTRIHKRA
jgi:hypothetical protein